jgi:hypothetical protein
MSALHEVQLSQDEAKFILAALDRSQIQGIGTARMVLQIAEKLKDAAGSSSGERIPRYAAGSDRSPADRGGGVGECQPANGASAKSETR